MAYISNWVESGRWEDQWIYGGSWDWEWVTGGYWDWVWVESGSWELQQQWVESGDWQWVDGYWLDFWSEESYTWEYFWVEGHNEWIDTSHYENVQVWVDTSHWEDRWLDSSHWEPIWVDASHWEPILVDTSHWEYLLRLTVTNMSVYAGTGILAPYNLALSMRDFNASLALAAGESTIVENSYPDQQPGIAQLSTPDGATVGNILTY